MKITIGYYDRFGKRIRTKAPKPGTNFYLVMGTLRRRIHELTDTTPYKVPINEHNVRFCDKRRLILEIMLYNRGRFSSKINSNVSWYNDKRQTIHNICSDVRKRIPMVARSHKVKIDNFHFQ